MTDTPENDRTLWITDAELIRRIGVPEKIARDAIRELDAQKALGFPQKSRVWGDRRYWPAVKAWFDQNHGAKVETSPSLRRVS